MALNNAAYYAGRDPFGRGGDFITAPEVSQMFGEIVGPLVRGCLAADGAAGGVSGSLSSGRDGAC